MENNNSVCFITKINKLSPIEGADKIELAIIEGWTSIVQKNIHKEGDLILCITTDAVIPEELAVKWGVTNYLRKGNRVRTVKLKGVYSECILIPANNFHHKEGTDMMKDFGIFKYEPPAIIVQEKSGRKHKYHQNPNFHIYYKFPNQKNTPNMFKNGDLVSITRKIHGTNARYGIVKKSKLSLLDKIKKFFGNKWIDYEYIYGSHNVEKGSDSQGFYSTDVWKEIAEKYDIKNKLWKYFKSNIVNPDSGFIIYGEIYGPGIQGEKYSYGLKSKEIVFFDIESNGFYLGQWLKEFVFKELNLPIVEKLYEGEWSKEIQDESVINQFIDGTNIPHEGIVVACNTGDRSKISKVINPDYTIYSEKHLIPDSH